MASHSSRGVVDIHIPNWLDETFCWNYVLFGPHWAKSVSDGSSDGYYDSNTYTISAVKSGNTVLSISGRDFWRVGWDGVNSVNQVNSFDDICTSKIEYRLHEGHVYSGGWVLEDGKTSWTTLRTHPEGRFVKEHRYQHFFKKETDGGISWLKAPGFWFAPDITHQIGIYGYHYRNAGWGDSH